MVISMKTDLGGEVTIQVSRIEAVYLDTETPRTVTVCLIGGRTFTSTKDGGLSGEKLYEVMTSFLAQLT